MVVLISSQHFKWRDSNPRRIIASVDVSGGLQLNDAEDHAGTWNTKFIVGVLGVDVHVKLHVRYITQKKDSGG